MNGCKFFFLGCFRASESEKEADGPGTCQPCIDRAAPLRIPVPPRYPFRLGASVLHGQWVPHRCPQPSGPCAFLSSSLFWEGCCVFLHTAGKAPLFQAPLQLAGGGHETRPTGEMSAGSPGALGGAQTSVTVYSVMASDHLCFYLLHTFSPISCTLKKRQHMCMWIRTTHWRASTTCCHWKVSVNQTPGTPTIATSSCQGPGPDACALSNRRESNACLLGGRDSLEGS